MSDKSGLDVLKNNGESGDIIPIKNMASIVKTKAVSVLVFKREENWYLPEILINPDIFPFELDDESDAKSLLEDGLILCDDFVEKYIGKYQEGQYAILTFSNNPNGFVKFVLNEDDENDDMNLYRYSINDSDNTDDLYMCTSMLVDQINLNNTRSFRADVYLTDIPIVNSVCASSVTESIIASTKRK